MQVQFTVTVNIGRRDAQPLNEFKKEDGKAFIPYLKEKIEEVVKNSWQYNAMVDDVKVTRKKNTSNPVKTIEELEQGGDIPTAY